MNEQLWGCMGARKSTEQIISEFVSIHGTSSYGYDDVIYINAHTKVKILCHGCLTFFYQDPHSHLKGSGCPNCAGIYKKTTDEFVKRAKQIHGNTYEYSKSEYVTTKTPLVIICKTHGEFLQSPQCHINRNQGCPKCKTKTHTKSTDHFILKSRFIHGNKYDYSKTNYIGVHKPVTIICSKHGDFQQTPATHYQGCGCPKCKTSKGELLIEKWLVDNNINFSPQYKFKDCKNIFELPFDFYIQSHNICIEYDGELHYHSHPRFGGKDKLKSTQKNDKIKSDYCSLNNIKLIRIPYTQQDVIADVLDKEFSNDVTIETWMDKNIK